MFSGFKSSYYLKPEDSRIPLGDVPMMPKLDSMNNLSPEENEKARETCKEYKALPQASTRAFTSKFKAGTLPLQAYLQPDPGNEIESDTDVDKNTASSDDEETSHASADYVDESPEWDSGSSSDSDIHEDIMEGNVTESVGFMHVNQCTTTRSGRMIVAAKRFMYDTGLFSSSSNEDYTYCSTCR